MNQDNNKTISHIAYYYVGNSNFNGDEFGLDIYMKNSDQTKFSSNTNWVNMSSEDLVYSGTVTLPNEAGWFTIQLSTEFEYDKTKSLVIAINRTTKNGDGSYTAGDAFNTTTGLNNEQSIYYGYASDSSPYDPSTISGSGTRYKTIPNIKITFDDGDSCTTPEDLTATVTSASTANVSWTARGDEEEWTLQYSTDDDFSVPANITTIEDITTNSKELTGLSANTTYYARVKAVCGDDDESDFTSAESFKTYCTASIPYSYSFEDATGYDTISTWVRRDLYTTSGISTLAYHIGEHSFRFYNNTTERTQYIISPELSGTGDGVHVSLYYKQKIEDIVAGVPTTTIQIGYSTTYNTTSSFTWDTEHSSTADAFIQYEYTCPAGTKFVAIKHHSQNYNYIYVDDISLTVPSCPVPTDLSAEVTSSTANITWETEGDADEWILYYSTSSSAPADNVYSGAGVVTDIDDTSYTLESLTGGTQYYVWVRTKCDEGNYSDWSDAVSFTTLFTASIPYSYSFEDATGYDTISTWTLRDIYSGSGISATTYNRGSHSFDFYNNNTERSQYLITPELSGTSNGVYVSLYYKQQYAGPTIQIGYSTTDYATASFTWDDAHSSTANTFIKYEYICPAGTKHVAIKYHSSGYTHIYVDDIVLAVPTYNAGDGDWNSTSSWSSGEVPTSSTDIMITSDITIPDGCSATANTVLISSDGSLTIAEGGILNITGRIDNSTAANLVIEDGGQLIATSTGVKATVQKSIEKSTATEKDGEGWYTISSAVDGPSIASETNLTTGDHDLYRYEENGSVWENYKAHAEFTTLESGRGYLYRNGADIKLSFAGELNAGTVSYSATNSGGELPGFNLIGNPYPHNIYKGVINKGGKVPAILNSSGGMTLTTGFYTITNDGAWTTCTDNSTPILPNQGFLVQATSTGSITISKTTEDGNAPSKYNSEHIEFTVGNSDYSDVTYAWFDKGIGLNKISHRNAAIPMLYIPQGDEDYAIAIMDDATEAFGLNFKAGTSGKYTLRYKAQGNFEYLHVIDRFTGEDVDMLMDGEYSFYGSTQDSEARFIVRLVYKPDYSYGGNVIFAYQSGDEILVSGEGELQVFDVLGRFVMSERINGVKTVSVPAQGVYVFRLVGENVKTQKIVVR